MYALFSREFLKVHKEYEQIKKENDNLKNQQRKITIDLISVLSIFTGIIAVCLGGFQLFQVAIANLTGQNDFKVILCVCLVAFVFFNAVMLLIYLIKKIAYNGCPEEEQNYKSAFYHIVVFLVEAVIISLIVVFCILYIKYTANVSR